jgi:hypothetical protein
MIGHSAYTAPVQRIQARYKFKVTASSKSISPSFPLGGMDRATRFHTVSELASLQQTKIAVPIAQFLEIEKVRNLRRQFSEYTTT